MSISSIILFVTILLILVIIHELGHFLVAKAVNMRVDEFAFGFPPKLFSKKIGETNYAFNLIPLGGYVSILGENGDENDKKNIEAKYNKRSFTNRPWWAQLLVLVAGVTMNMILAFFIFVFISYGEVVMSVDDPIYGSRVKNKAILVTEVQKESPAYKAGIKPGSTILEISSLKTKADLMSATSVISFIEKNQNNSFNIKYKTQDGVERNTTLAAVYGIVPNKKALGIGLDQVGTVKTTIPESVVVGYEKTVAITYMTLDGLKSVIKSLVNGDDVLKSLSGPVGIAKIVGETSEYGYVAILTLIAVLSINLAIFNILPLPALDGGRMVVVLIETIIKKKIPFNYYSWVNVIGFVFLVLLLVLVTINDIRA